MKIRPSIYSILLVFITGIIVINSSDLGFGSVVQAQASSCTTITEIPESECQALNSIYQSTAGADWINNTEWFTTNTPCSWYGVICDSSLDTISHVNRLELTQNNLVGSIPANIAELAYLEELDFSYNQLQGSIPTTVGSLDKLIWLSLHDNQISGEIPTELGNLPMLQLLSLSSNQLTGPVPPTLGSLSNLTKLHLSENQFSGEIPQSISDLYLLEILDISSNQLTGPISLDLANLGALQELNLARNQLGGEIPAGLGDLSDLRLLSLSVNQLTGPLPSLENLAALQEIYLSDNLLDGPIPAEFGNLTLLEHLALDGNQLNGEIPPVLGNLAMLRELRLNDNQLTGSLPSQIGNLSDLVSLVLHNNQLSGPIPAELGRLSNLAIFSANGNQLSGPIPAQLGDLTNLTGMGLAGNRLSGKIPATLGNLTRLEQLMLQSNQLTGEVPASLTTLPVLNPIMVSYNGLTASEPVVQNLLNQSDSSWAETQTVAPTGLSSNFSANTAAADYDLHLGWQTIAYVNDGGYYEIDYALASSEIYQEGGTTANKQSRTFKLSGLATSTEYVVRVRAYTPAHGSQQNDIWSDHATLLVKTPPPIILDCELEPTDAGENCFDLDDENKEVSLSEGEFLTIKLPTIPSSGSYWYIVNADTGENNVGTPILRPLERPEFRMPDLPYPVVGQTGTEIYRFDPVAPGMTTINLEYRDLRGNVLDTYTVQINNEGTFDNVQTPSTPPQNTSSLPTHSPDQPGGRAARSSRVTNALPLSYSLCDHPDGNNYCPPIQYQGSCGSCWAFTTVGAMETLIKYKDGVERDLSEQALLSCNNESAGTDPATGQEKHWSCANGGWYAFDYYTNKKTEPHQSGPGTVWELDFIYTGEDLACTAGLMHHEKLTSWSYINTEKPLSMNYVEDIKLALYEYGPIVTSLCVGPEINAYRGGIFDTDESAVCTAVGQDTNHAVVLVGWDDTEGVWIMRNSWDTWWGEEGYMRIKYGTSNIGFGAAYALYEGSEVKGPNAPAEFSVTPEIVPEGYQLLMNWADNSDDETGFQIFSQIDGNWQVAETLPANTTAFTTEGIECNKNYTYRLAAINDEGVSGYSNMVKVSAECEDLQAPANFTAIANDASITLEWENVNVLQDGVLVLRWNWETEGWDELVTVDTDTQRFIDRTDLEPGQTYAYILRAFVGERFSQPTDYQKVTAPIVQVEGPTKARAEVVSNGNIRLNWEDNSQNEDGYIIMRYNSTSKEWEQIQTLDIDATEHVDVQLDCGDQEVHYQVVAYRGSVQSPVSNQVSTLPCPKIVEEATPVPSDTPTDVPAATSTEIPTETSTATAMPTETATVTPMPTETSTETSTEMPTAMATETATSVATETLIPTEIPTEMPTEAPTDTPQPTVTPTSEPAPTLTIVPESTPTVTPTVVPTVIPDEVGLDQKTPEDKWIFLPIILQ